MRLPSLQPMVQSRRSACHGVPANAVGSVRDAGAQGLRPVRRSRRRCSASAVSTAVLLGAGDGAVVEEEMERLTAFEFVAVNDGPQLVCLTRKGVTVLHLAFVTWVGV